MSEVIKAKNRGRAFESRVAKFFGTVRTPLSGGASRHTRSDTLHTRLFVEAKHRGGHSIRAAYERARAARDDARRDALILHDEDHGWMTAVASNSWNLLRKSPYESLFLHPNIRHAVKRKHTAVGALLQHTRALAALEEKTAMVCLGDKNRPGFLIVVFDEDWDAARKEAGG